MQLILIGDKTSTLTSLVPESNDIELVTLSRSLDSLAYTTLLNSESDRGLIIIDSTTCDTPLSSLFQELKKKFPSFEIWVYYLFKSSVIYNKLKYIGFQKVLSSSDDIPKLIHQYFENKYNKETGI